MYGKHNTIQLFLAVADFYFRLTGKTAAEMNGAEMEEVCECVTKCNTPDGLQKSVTDKIRSETGVVPGTENIHAGGWYMLPPGQRIL